MATPSQEPLIQDSQFVLAGFDLDTIQLALWGLQRYRPFLERMKDVEARFHLERSAVSHEMTSLDRMVQWCNERLAESQGDWPFPFQITYGSLRWLKAGILFEVQALREARNEIFSKYAVLPVSVIEAINSKISSIENMAETGQFNGMRPMPLAYGTVSVPPVTVRVVDSPAMDSTGPTIVMHVELMDSELRRRCGDLYEQFTSDPANQDRFDTVLREASTLLEDRIRGISGLSASVHGLELVSQALRLDAGELVLPGEKAEQEAAFLLFRGFFGFVRNTVGHRLVPAYTKERAAQVLGLADYLLFILSQGQRRNPPSPLSPPSA